MNKTYQDAEMYNRGVKYIDKENYTKALVYFKKEKLEFKELHLNMGACYKYLNQDDKAWYHYTKAADHSMPYADGRFGGYAAAINNLALMCYANEETERSLEYYKEALRLDPDYHSARWHMGISQMRLWLSNKPVDVGEALVNYDYRFYVDKRKTVIDTGGLPRWDGVTKGKSIVVVVEQGIGDQIQWFRYCNLLHKFFDKVWVQCGTGVRVIFKGIDFCYDPRETDAEYCVPLCSLTRWFPPDAAPHNAHIQDYLPHDFGDPNLKIGFINSGNKGHVNDYNRSCSIHHFLDLGGPGRTLYNLQPGARDIKGVVNLNPSSWVKTMSYIQGLDLVVSVDTSIVHLAGSMDVPCWMVMPLKDTDFRWGDSSCGYDQVWYPSVEVFRNPGSWERTFKNVKERLNGFNRKSS